MIPPGLCLQTSFYFSIIYEVLWMYTVLYDEPNVPKERDWAQGREKKVKSFPQRNLQFRIYLSCSYYLNTQLLNQFLANIPDICIPILLLKWINSEMRFVWLSFLISKNKMKMAGEPSEGHSLILCGYLPLNVVWKTVVNLYLEPSSY